MTGQYERIESPRIITSSSGDPKAPYLLECQHCPWKKKAADKTEATGRAKTHRYEHQRGLRAVTK